MAKLNFSDMVSTAFKAVTDIFSRQPADAELDVQTLRDLLEANRQAHKELSTTLASVFTVANARWFEDKMTSIADNASFALTSYSLYQNNLNSAAHRDEAKTPFLSLATVNEVYYDAIGRVLDFIKVEYGNNNIPLNEVKVSAIAMAGILGSSDIILRYTNYIFTSLIKAAVNASAPDLETPKYREEFIEKHTVDMANLVNAVYDSRKRIDIRAITEALRKRDGDVVLHNGITTDNFAAASVVPVLVTAGGVMAFLYAYATHIYKLLGNGGAGILSAKAINDKYDALKEQREWMARHVALLRLEMEGTNPDDPRYRELVKIIEAYDERITACDYRIAKYEQELNS